MTDELTTRAREILAALQNAGTWLDRNEIADIIGKARLNPNDVKQLDELSERGLVERKQEQSGITSKYVYKAS